MKQKDAYDLLIKEYLSKCNETGCDGCIAEFYCIENHLRTDRYPQKDCPKKFLGQSFYDLIFAMIL